MEWKISRCFLVGLCIFPMIAFASKREFLINLNPNSIHIDGLGCAFSVMPSARGVKFENQTETCTTLASAWFSSPTYDARTSYFTLAVNKIFFPKVSSFGFPFPTNFAVGGSAILLLETGTIGYTNSFNIEFKTTAGSTLGFLMTVREYEYAVVYNSYINGWWGWEQRMGNPFTISNNIYKLEFKVTATHVQTYIDNNLFHSFSHRTSYSNYQVFHFSSTGSTYTSEQIWFTYPDV